MRADIENYVQVSDGFMSLKAKKNKFNDCSQKLSILTHEWKYLSIDFIIGLFKSQNLQEVEYNSILLIVAKITKILD